MTETKPDFFFQLTKAHSKEYIFDQVCQSLVLQGVLTDKDNVLAELMQREKLASTQISEICAMPHCQSDQVVTSKIVYVDCANYPLNWNTEEKSVEQIVFLLLAEIENKQRLCEIRDFVRLLAIGNYQPDQEVSYQDLN